jgi:large subunit ribosomal protein L19
MESVIQKIEKKFKKRQVIDVHSGDTVKVHQKIREGNKERIQIFQGLVIRVDRKGSLSSRIVVRRIASGVGVEKSFLLHSPLVLKVEVTKRSKVRRNYLTYMRARTGKSARLSGTEFDREAVNAIKDEAAEAEEEKLKAETAATAEAAAEAKEAGAEDKSESEEKPKAEEQKAGKQSDADKAAGKKAKAEAFRQAQESKS